MQVKRILMPAVFVAVVLAVLGSVLLVRQNRIVSAAATGPQRACTADSGWNAEGTVLRAKKQTAIARERAIAPNTRIFNSGDFAYSSQPVTLAGTADYTFDFGPLPQNFTWPAPDLAFSVQWPSDFRGQVQPPRTPEKIVTKSDGQRYLEAVLPVQGASCTGLVLWYY